MCWSKWAFAHRWGHFRRVRFVMLLEFRVHLVWVWQIFDQRCKSLSAQHLLSVWIHCEHSGRPILFLSENNPISDSWWYQMMHDLIFPKKHYIQKFFGKDPYTIRCSLYFWNISKKILYWFLYINLWIMKINNEKIEIFTKNQNSPKKSKY